MQNPYSLNAYGYSFSHQQYDFEITYHQTSVYQVWKRSKTEYQLLSSEDICLYTVFTVHSSDQFLCSNIPKKFPCYQLRQITNVSFRLGC